MTEVKARAKQPSKVLALAKRFETKEEAPTKPAEKDRKGVERGAHFQSIIKLWTTKASAVKVVKPDPVKVGKVDLSAWRKLLESGNASTREARNRDWRLMLRTAIPAGTKPASRTVANKLYQFSLASTSSATSQGRGLLCWFAGFSFPLTGTVRSHRGAASGSRQRLPPAEHFELVCAAGGPEADGRAVLH